MEERDKKIYSLLGLAMRGRNLVSGEDQVLESIRDGSAFLVVIAGDTSAGSRKRFTDKASYYQVPVLSLGTKEELGSAIGKEYRSAAAICEKGLAEKIRALAETRAGSEADAASG